MNRSGESEVQPKGHTSITADLGEVSSSLWDRHHRAPRKVAESPGYPDPETSSQT
jgi:hypothetical protein